MGSEQQNARTVERRRVGYGAVTYRRDESVGDDAEMLVVY